MREKAGMDDPNQDVGSKGNDEELGTLGILFGALVWVVIGFFYALSNDTSREFMERNRSAMIIVGIVFALIASIAFAISPIRNRLRVKSSRFKAGTIIFIAAPLLLTIVGAVGYFPPRFQVTGLRIIFLLIVCLLPPTLWYLFMATRKWSVLNDFLANLRCLGLLEPRPVGRDEVEDESSFKRRFYNYLEKFDAVYGPLPSQTRDDIVAKGYLGASSAVVDGGTRSVISTTAVPVLISTAMFVLGWVITLPPVPDNAAALIKELPLGERWVTALIPAETSVSFAFLGAYFFGIQLLFRRYIRNDLAGAAYVKVVMRVILAVIAAWAASAALLQLNAQVTDAQLLVVGFTVGIFPSVGVDLIKKSFRSITGLVVDTDNQLPLRELDGMTIFHETRLDEEDIENVSNMASADVVELLLKTRFPAERIVDWVDQAILLTQLGRTEAGQAGRHTLSDHGIRSASSLLAAADADSQGSDAFFKILDPESRMPALLAAIHTGPNVEMVLKWKSHAVPLVDSIAIVRLRDHDQIAGTGGQALDARVKSH